MNSSIKEKVFSFDRFKKNNGLTHSAFSAQINPFFTYEWFSIWWKYFQNKNRRLCVFFSTKETILPFYLEDRKLYKELCCLGRGLIDYEDGFGEDDSSHLLIDLLRGENADLISLIHIREDAPIFSSLKETDSKFYNDFKIILEKSVKSPFLRIKKWNNFEEYLRSKKNLKTDIPRRIRRLSEKGELKFAYCASCNEIKYVLGTMYEQHIRRRQFLGQRKSIFTDSNVRDFFNEVSCAVSNNRLFYLKLDRDIIAIAYCFQSQEKLYYYIPTFDLEYSNYSPGKVLLYFIIKYAFENNLKEIDFMIGEEDYKLRWNTDIRQTYNLYIYYRKKLTGKVLILVNQVIKNNIISKIKNFLHKIGIIDTVKFLRKKWYTAHHF